MALCVARTLRVIRLTRWGFIFTELVKRVLHNLCIIVLVDLVLVIGLAVLLHWVGLSLSLSTSINSRARNCFSSQRIYSSFVRLTHKYLTS
jgi:hypothetical protein